MIFIWISMMTINRLDEYSLSWYHCCVFVNRAYGTTFHSEKATVLQVTLAHNAIEASFMPWRFNSFNITIASFNSESTCFASGTKEFVETFNAVGFITLHMEHPISEGFGTSNTYKAVNTPCLVQCMHYFPDDFLVAFCTCIGVVFFVALRAVSLSFFLYETDALKWFLATWWGADKAFRMPVLTFFGCQICT